MSVILLIEDSVLDQKYITSGLEKIGYTTVCVANGQLGLDYLNSVNPLPDMIICDIVMPVMNGYQFIRIVKNSDVFSKIPIIAISIKDRQYDIQWAMRQGADAFMPKPFSIDKLIDRIRINLKD